MQANQMIYQNNGNNSGQDEILKIDDYNQYNSMVKIVDHNKRNINQKMVL